MPSLSIDKLFDRLLEMLRKIASAHDCDQLLVLTGPEPDIVEMGKDKLACLYCCSLIFGIRRIQIFPSRRLCKAMMIGISKGSLPVKSGAYPGLAFCSKSCSAVRVSLRERPNAMV